MDEQKGPACPEDALDDEDDDGAAENLEAIRGTLWWIAILFAGFFLIWIIRGCSGSEDAGVVNAQRETNRILRVLAEREAKILLNSREEVREVREQNKNLRQVITELQGIHNDCQRNVTDSFLQGARSRR